MSSLLEAANSSADKFILDGSLPKRKGEVSIMPLSTLERLCDTDQTERYGTATYHVYGICDSTGHTGSETGSTLENLQAIGLDWYKQLNKPTSSTIASQIWMQAGHKIFGGPFHYIDSNKSGFGFSWWYSTTISYKFKTRTDNRFDCSYSDKYWHDTVDSSVYVAIVKAR